MVGEREGVFQLHNYFSLLLQIFVIFVDTKSLV